ncbi:SPFH domain-containing protein [Aquimarina spongiae]|uniref:Membrane protease subunit, stomatin/prohibitin family, contains C-terminal Zn-ribbon domain n=1 Tax=Aquimarina spongiae TaxID=570521 RepID=A0A1M6KMB4_9FLAO|nr:SPFH domain-containing protein [Aquimarina spongiae]SHJ60042.1 Membrane protease subunit, stomatin/prohibitin family, contains C-terminal Zn-ribbon domain [Aquimarina spongiae]
MSNSFSNQLRSVIEWHHPKPETLFEKWTENGDEIKNASKLIVGPGQGCLFVYEGEVKGFFEKEGLYDLKTGNIPFWTTIKSIMYKFESAHKVGIFFYRKAEMQNIRWGTPSPITYKDPVYNFPVGLGAFGNFSFRITKPVNFFTNVIAGDDYYPVKAIQKVILSRITQPISDFLANASFSYIEIDKHRNEIASFSKNSSIQIFDDLGFELLDFRIEGTSFDEETRTRIGRIADMSAEAQAMKELGVSYQDYQQLEALKNMAKNEGNGNLGMQMGAGLGMGQMLGNMMNNQTNQGQTSSPQPPPSNQNTSSEDDLMQKLEKLKKMFDAGLIDEQEYKQKKQEILSQL